MNSQTDIAKQLNFLIELVAEQLESDHNDGKEICCYGSIARQKLCDFLVSKNALQRTKTGGYKRKSNTRKSVDNYAKLESSEDDNFYKWH